jgi:hypothetical protein
MDAKLLRKRIADRLKEVGKKSVPVSEALGKGRDYLPDFLRGKKESIGIEILGPLADQLECDVSYLVDPDAPVWPAAPREVLIRIRGQVGASPDGQIIFSTGDALNDFALMPQGATPNSTALLVRGHSMRGVADDGSLIFYEEVRTPPTPDMLGHVVVVETEAGDVLIKRLLRGERRGHYDLESIVGPTLFNQRLRWAAHLQSIVPPHRARQITRSLAA